MKQATGLYPRIRVDAAELGGGLLLLVELSRPRAELARAEEERDSYGRQLADAADERDALTPTPGTSSTRSPPCATSSPANGAAGVG